MRILYLGNNWVGWQVLRWLTVQQEEIVGLVVHEPHKQRYTEELLHAAGLPAERVFTGPQLRDPTVRSRIATLAPDIGLSVLFGYLLAPEFLTLFPRGVVNLHPALLPHNRGPYPNVWSIVDGTPSGVTLHYVDDGIDTGDVIAQCNVPVEPVDTGETLYRKLEQASVALFKEAWPKLKAGLIQRRPQPRGRGTCRRCSDVEAIDAIDPDRAYVARDLINVLRARTFPPYPGAYVTVDGRRIYLRLQLSYDADEPRTT